MEKKKVQTGLRLVFAGNIAGILVIIPFLGICAVIAAGILQLVGLLILRKQNEGYNMTLICTIAATLFGMCASGDSMTSSAMSLLREVASLIGTYCMCTATADCVEIVSYNASEYCISVRNWYVTCMAIGLAISAVMIVFAIIPLFGTIVALIGSLALVVVAIFEFVASIRYLIMLWKSQKVLG